jgi:hypothetical protein
MKEPSNARSWLPPVALCLSVAAWIGAETSIPFAVVWLLILDAGTPFFSEGKFPFIQRMGNPLFSHVVWNMDRWAPPRCLLTGR